MAAPPAPPSAYGYPPADMTGPLFTGPGSAGAGSSSAPPQPWDMGPLQAALNTSAATPPPSTGSSDMYLDTGASAHMFSNSGNLHSVRPAASSSQIVVGNGALLPITHTGAGTIIGSNSKLQLRNVLLSPSLIKNLLSVRQLTRDNPVSVEFDKFGFSIKDIRTGEVIM